MIRLAAAMIRTDGQSVAEWLADIAAAMLTKTAVVAGGHTFRVVECETYYHAADHPDPYVHSHDVQKNLGRWYVHRVGRGYRGGNYKGIDVTFGDGDSRGGLLIRAMDGPTKVRGPSKCVDALLAATGIASPAALDAAFAHRHVWDSNMPVRLIDADFPAEIVASPRVGLSTKHPGPLYDDYRGRHYRYRVATARMLRPPPPPRR